MTTYRLGLEAVEGCNSRQSAGKPRRTFEIQRYIDHLKLLTKRKIILLSFLAFLLIAALAGCNATDSSGNGNSSDSSSGPSQAPDFTMSGVDGGTITLSDFQGKPILLNFAASWCGPCELEAPVLKNAYDKYKDQVAFVGAAVKDNADSQRAFAEKHGLEFPIGLDPSGSIAYSYQKAAKVSISGIPTTFFIKKDGTIATFWVGPLTESNLETLMSMITES